jgi:hypothetical protein
LGQALEAHARQVAAAGADAIREARESLAPLEGALERTAQAVLAAHGELADQRKLLLRTIEAAGDLTRLEEALDRNLSALAGSQHFEETVQSLAAVIHLLNARLGHVPLSAALAARAELRSPGQQAA